MKTKTRILIEILGPAPIGTILLFITKYGEFARTSGVTPQIFFGYMLAAYAFAIIPSLIYALFMELWFKYQALRALGRFGVIGFSTILGLAAGYAVFMASEAHVILIGPIVGLIMGVVLSFSKVDGKSKTA